MRGWPLQERLCKVRHENRAHSGRKTLWSANVCLKVTVQSDPMPPSQSNRAASLTTPLAQDALVFRHLHAFERLSLPYEYRVTALAAERDVDLDALLGETCSLTVQTLGGRLHFHGRCAQIAFIGNEDGGLLYDLILRPELWFMSRNRNCRIFQNQSATDIVSSLLQENGITRFDFKLKNGFPPVRTYCVQYMESDFAFISRLLEHEGLHYFFRHDASGTNLVIADSNEAHDVIDGYDDIPYYPPGEVRERESHHLDEWSAVHGVGAPVSTKATDFFYKRPTPMVKSEQTGPAYTGDNADMQIHPAGYEDASRGETLALYRLEAERALRAYAASSGNALGLRPGCKFTLRNHPHSGQNREHLVVETRLHYHADAYAAGSGLAGASNDRMDLISVRSDTPFRQPLSTPRPRIPGTQTAIVVGKQGEEIDTEEVGAVKVSFHWDTYSKNNETSSCWVRVGQSWAGPGWGGLFTPRIGMEVLVEFIDGDPDRPIIVGAVYNGANAPPYGLPGAKTRSTIKSNSSKGGGGFNEIRFEDKKGSEEIYIHAQKDQNVEILNNLSTTVGNTEKRKVGTSRSTQIGTSDTKTTGTSESTTVGTDRSVTVAMNDTLNVGMSRSESIGMSDSLTVGMTRTSTVGISDDTTVGASASLNVGGAYTVNVGGAMMVNVGGAMNITAGGVVNIMAPMVTVMGGIVVITGKSVQVG